MTDQTATDVLTVLGTIVAERSTHHRPVPRKALTRAEAAESLGMSVDHFERHVQPELRLIRSGRLVLVPTAELDRWADRVAAITLDRKTTS